VAFAVYSIARKRFNHENTPCVVTSIMELRSALYFVHSENKKRRFATNGLGSQYYITTSGPLYQSSLESRMHYLLFNAPLWPAVSSLDESTCSLLELGVIILVVVNCPCSYRVFCQLRPSLMSHCQAVVRVVSSSLGIALLLQ
jgi:hypothetical protein